MMDKNELLRDRNQLIKWVKEELIFKRLNLQDLGLSIDDFDDNTPLFHKSGLDLDSVDGLELAVGIEQKLGLKIGKLTEDTAKNKFSTVRSICDYIFELNLMKMA